MFVSIILNMNNCGGFRLGIGGDHSCNEIIWWRSMKMLREVVILSLLVMITLCVLNVAAVSFVGASQMHSGSSTYRININSVNKNPYSPKNKIPPFVGTTLNLEIVGNVTKDGKPVSGGDGVYIYHGEVIGNVPNPTQWIVPISQLDPGTFDDTFQFSSAGRHDLIYTYFWGDGSSDFCQSDVISIYAIKSA